MRVLATQNTVAFAALIGAHIRHVAKLLAAETLNRWVRVYVVAIRLLGQLRKFGRCLFIFRFLGRVHSFTFWSVRVFTEVHISLDCTAGDNHVWIAPIIQGTHVVVAVFPRPLAVLWSRFGGLLNFATPPTIFTEEFGLVGLPDHLGRLLISLVIRHLGHLWGLDDLSVRRDITPLCHGGTTGIFVNRSHFPALALVYLLDAI